MFISLKGCVALAVAIGALGVVAGPALASTHEFEVEGKPSSFVVTGQSGPVEFNFSKGNVTLGCTASSISKTVESKTLPAKELTVEPTFSNCALSGAAATVDNPCNYAFTGETDALGHARVHIECAGGSRMQLTLNGCTIAIGPQTPEEGVHYVNTGSGSNRDVDMQVTLKNVGYEEIGVLCALIGGLGGELTIRGTYTTTAYQDKEKTEGSQIGMWMVTTF
jgi:hypothetical protein